jgi:hypothetical protein
LLCGQHGIESHAIQVVYALAVPELFHLSGEGAGQRHGKTARRGMGNDHEMFHGVSCIPEYVQLAGAITTLSMPIGPAAML